MTPIDRYFAEVKRNLFVSPPDAARLETDLRAHFAEAEARGEPFAETVQHLGTPEEVASAFNAEREIRYAGFWQRVVAFLGDGGLLLTLALPPVGLVLLFDAGLLGTSAPSALRSGALIGLALAAFGLLVFYFPLLEARFGKTLGKHLLRLRVVRENGAPIGLGQAFVRRLSLYFDIWVVDALFVPFTKRRQRALDIVAKTIVAREPGVEAPWWGWAVCLLLPLGSFLSLLALVLVCAPA